MNISVPTPSEVSASGDLARLLARLLGPAYQAHDGTRIAADLLGTGDALADVRETLDQALDEAFVHLATDLLSELEEMYGLTVRTDMSTTERRARLLAKVRAARAGTPDAIELAASSLDSTATVYENTAADVEEEPRNVYLWVLQVASAVWNDPTKRAQLREIVEQMKPGHTRGWLAVDVGFLADTSIVGRDVVL